MAPRIRLVFDRRERKFPFSADAWERLEQCAARYMPVECFDGENALNYIRTTYLDTPDLHSYREYVERKPIRTKVRIRQYGRNGQVNGVCWVEIKVKRQRKTAKRRFRCTPAKVSELIDGRDIREDVVAANPDRPKAIRIYEAAREMILERRLRPVVRVDYERLAFQHPTEPESRITLDRAIRYRPAVGPARAAHDGVILEAKHADTEPDWVPEFLRELALDKSSRFSKFARAVQALGVNGSTGKESA